jgi:hypothetical protein
MAIVAAIPSCIVGSCTTRCIVNIDKSIHASYHSCIILLRRTTLMRIKKSENGISTKACTISCRNARFTGIVGIVQLSFVACGLPFMMIASLLFLYATQVFPKSFKHKHCEGSEINPNRKNCRQHLYTPQGTNHVTLRF